jgi:hypothetical protein
MIRLIGFCLGLEVKVRGSIAGDAAFRFSFVWCMGGEVCFLVCGRSLEVGWLDFEWRFHDGILMDSS